MPVNLEKKSSDQPERGYQPNSTNPPARAPPGLNSKSCMHQRHSQHTRHPQHPRNIHYHLNGFMQSPSSWTTYWIGQHIQKWITYQENLSYTKLLSDGIPYSMKTINTFKSMKKQMDLFPISSPTQSSNL